MKARKVAIGLTICLMASAVFAEDTVAPFAKKFIGLDLETFPLGKDISRDRQFREIKLSYNLGETNFAWYSGPASAKYSQEHPDARLVYGVQNDKVAMLVVITMVSPGVNDGAMRKTREEVIRLRAFDLDDGHYHIRYHAECGPRTQDPLVSSAVTITSSEIKK